MKAYIVQCFPPEVNAPPQFFIVNDEPVQARKTAEHWLRSHPRGRARIGRVEFTTELVSTIVIEEAPGR